MIKLFSSGLFGRVPDPPEQIECSPENYDRHDCKFCVNEKYCRQEYEEASERGDIEEGSIKHQPLSE